MDRASNENVQGESPRFVELAELAGPMGFTHIGVTPAIASARAVPYQQWLAEGLHGEMDYLARNVALRLDPGKLLAGARSIVCVADRYHHNLGQAPMSASTDHALGHIARYAWGDDYHKVLKKRLHALADALRDRWPGHAHKVCVDTAPLLEREHAARAGLGWVGKHTLLIHPRLGSWLLLGAIVTTLDIEKKPGTEGWGTMSGGDPASSTPVPGSQTQDLTTHCGTCTRCIDACPTHCITPYQLDATRCISYLTLEHRSPIAPDLHPPMGNWLGGCDICQEVCPFNSPDRLPIDPPPHPQYASRPPAPALPLAQVLDWTEADRRAAFRGSALKRMKLDMVRRNAVIAAGNHLAVHPDAVLYARIQAISADADEPAVVRDTARQVLVRLRESPPTVRRN